MKKIAILFFLLGPAAIGQVGINTTSPNAQLDIRASNPTTPTITDGLLIPSIDEFPSPDPGVDQDGILVFVTGSGTPSRGLYYWDNSASTWTQFALRAATWGITGNAGTDGGTTNFLGTTDNQPLMIRVNDTERLRITNTGQLEILNTNQSVFIGQGAAPTSTGLSNIAIGNNAGNALTTGQYNILLGEEAGSGIENVSNNTIIGAFSGSSITTGSLNTFVGSGAGGVTTEGSNNTMIGLSTGQRNNAGERNTMMGRSAGLFNYAGNRNVYLGMNAGEGNSDTGEALAYSNNVFIGYDAGNNVAGSNNVFIGYQAGLSEGGSDRLYIENTSATTPLIGGDFSNDRVGVNRPIGSLSNTFEVGGTASKATAGTWAANSDRRLKKNIQAIDGHSALDLISKMRGVTFEWNDDKTGINRPVGKQYGFIAQELKEVFPARVTKDRLGFYQTAYGDYDPLVVEAIKELDRQLKQKDQQIEMLSSRLEKIERLLGGEKVELNDTTDK